MAREDLIDALRGLALFGILAVNIQSFVWGIGAPSMGVFSESSGLADKLTVFFTALLLEYKFYPIFCFCFGYGFAMQTRRWAVLGVDVRERFTRRMNFMLFMGVLHGVFLWFGDILARYALAGLILRRHVRKGPRALLTAIIFWLAITVVAGIGLSLVSGIDPESFSAAAGQSEQAQRDGEHVFEIYTEAGYMDATIQRAEDFFTVTLMYVFVLPQVMLLFLLGALAAQLKLLRYPSRFRAFWRRVFWFGVVVGLPINIAFAWTQVSASSDAWTQPSVWQAVLSLFAPLLAAAYVAAFALAYDTSLGTALRRCLVPAGRVALTLYVLQSLLMMMLLNGFGLGLGATLGQFELFVIAVAVYACLLAVAHVMQRFAIPAPLEKIWRRYTYATESRKKT